MVYVFRPLSIILTMLLSWSAYAQDKSDFYHPNSGFVRTFALRAGTNYSIPTVSALVGPQIVYLAGVVPKYGFYVGGTYFKDIIPDRLSIRLDATFQEKGDKSEFNGNIVGKSSYYYVSLSPLLGLHLTNNLTIYTGLEANQLIKTKEVRGTGSSIELGITSRLTYGFGRYAIEASYFRGLTKYNQLTLRNVSGEYYEFYNQNVQVGLMYTIGRSKG